MRKCSEKQDKLVALASDVVDELHHLGLRYIVDKEQKSFYEKIKGICPDLGADVVVDANYKQRHIELGKFIGTLINELKIGQKNAINNFQKRLDNVIELSKTNL
jgi:hypothetical protein